MMNADPRLRWLIAVAAFVAAIEAMLSQPKSQEMPGPKPDFIIGRADAPVTIMEFASLTCPHCAHFHEAVLPDLKKKYLDTGKAKLIFRDFPLDDASVAGALLARCLGDPDKALAMIAVLFKAQNVWAADGANVADELRKIAKQAGFTDGGFETCLSDQKRLDEMTKGVEFAEKTLGVDGTPAFFVNGQKMTEPPTIEGFDKVLGPLAAK